MRYELSDYEWTAIKPMLLNKPRGVSRAGACCQSAGQR
jgi:transposase